MDNWAAAGSIVQLQQHLPVVVLVVVQLQHVVVQLYNQR